MLLAAGVYQPAFLELLHGIPYIFLAKSGEISLQFSGCQWVFLVAAVCLQ
jgi:hypothetical protein